ncbi:4-demethylwyosine synthase TYW1 [Candidatus Woesearchaeota archaeon]|nr:4-demethylwyosine synthase TYW1 [Candidatus Woesearchaeota archaeon]
MISELKKKDLYHQGYRVVGNHSAVKVCLWCKKAIRKEDSCYKSTFYGINSHRCVQMTPALQFCSNRCIWCWRDVDFTKAKWTGPVDKPKDIVDGCIEEHIRYLRGFGGNPKRNKKRYEESLKPKHFAISLAGEPTLYPKLPELIKEIHSRGMTSFLVTNGTNPSMLKRLIKNQPTQIYMTLPAPDEETYKKVCSPLIKNQWENIIKTLKLLKNFKRSAIRLTLVKNYNMIKPDEYAELIESSGADFVEAKAYMWVGYSRQRLSIKKMPLFPEIKKFSKEIVKHSSLKIIDEKKESRVVLLMKKDRKDRIIEF